MSILIYNFHATIPNRLTSISDANAGLGIYIKDPYAHNYPTFITGNQQNKNRKPSTVHVMIFKKLHRLETQMLHIH